MSEAERYKEAAVARLLVLAKLQISEREWLSLEPVFREVIEASYDTGTEVCTGDCYDNNCPLHGMNP